MEVTRIGEEAVLKTAGRKTCGFESHGLRSDSNEYAYCGLSDRISVPVLHRGSTVSNPSRTIRSHGHGAKAGQKGIERVRISILQLAPRPHSVQSGVDATLSRWRSPVQIRYGSLGSCLAVRYANG